MMKNINQPSPAQKKLLTYLVEKRKMKIDKDEVIPILDSIRRFVMVVHKIYTEPQATIFYKEFKEDGKKIKKRVITTTLEEIDKVKTDPNEPITIKTIRDTYQQITKSKYKPKDGKSNK